MAHHNLRERHVFRDIPQGSVLGVAAFNVFLNELKDGGKSLLNCTQIGGHEVYWKAGLQTILANWRIG